MKTPYTLRFQDYNVKAQVLNQAQVLKWCSRPLLYSEKNILYSTPEFSILRQYCNYKPFFIDVIEINSEKDFECQFEIHGKQVFMFFMLHGDLNFHDVTNHLIAHTPEESFLMAYYDTGMYNVKITKGKKLALAITIGPEWLEKVSSEYEHIYRFVTEFKKRTTPYLALYRGEMEKNVRRWIHKVYYCQKTDIGLLDALIRENMTLVLKKYNKLLNDFWLAFDVRAFIIEHLTDEDLSMDMLSDYFKISKRVLSYVFKKIFNENIPTYINGRRMDLAEKLMPEDNLTISQVYMLVGYKDEGTFRYHYNRCRKMKKK